MAERLRYWAFNQKVAGSIPGHVKLRCGLGQGTSPYLPWWDCTCTYCMSLWISVSCKCNLSNFRSQWFGLVTIHPAVSFAFPTLPPPFFHNIWSSLLGLLLPPSSLKLNLNIWWRQKSNMFLSFPPSLYSLSPAFTILWTVQAWSLTFGPVTQPNCPPPFSSYPPGWSLSFSGLLTLVSSVSLTLPSY